MGIISIEYQMSEVSRKRDFMVGRISVGRKSITSKVGHGKKILTMRMKFWAQGVYQGTVI
jgi:hypothetical protein